MAKSQGSPHKKTGAQGKLTPQQQKLMGALLAGKPYREAAEISGFSVQYIHNLMGGREERYKWFKDEYETRLAEQGERICEREPDRSKEALIAELEEVAGHCRDGKPILDKEGGIIDYDRDHTNWIKTIVERGKLLGYYIDKKELSGTVQTVSGPVYDFEAFTDEELEQFAALEAKATRLPAGP